jgi:BMFP domain-containing protein YqiC
MQSQNRFFDDLARVASGAVGAISGVRGEIEQRLRDQLERVLAGMDLVTREEFEAVKAMAAKAREEQESLQRQVAELQARLADTGKARSARSRTQSPEGKIDP